ncbi:hypothetical protein HMPREF0297_1491 [Corynebacterium jeikeium ATCC 43734]|nr:hypothetical protein HMPREF0297_1491 [Corynebacterium jeikeium ATCC 43734]
MGHTKGFSDFLVSVLPSTRHKTHHLMDLVDRHFLNSAEYF